MLLVCVFVVSQLQVTYGSQNPHGSAAIRKIPITSALRISDIKFKDYKGILHCFRVEDDADRSSRCEANMSQANLMLSNLNSQQQEFCRSTAVSQNSPVPTVQKCWRFTVR